MNGKLAFFVLLSTFALLHADSSLPVQIPGVSSLGGVIGGIPSASSGSGSSSSSSNDNNLLNNLLSQLGLGGANSGLNSTLGGLGSVLGNLLTVVGFLLQLVGALLAPLAAGANLGSGGLGALNGILSGLKI
ncbi:hypothetical protein QR680_010828 [Steinernema hermaphroditum]|uniref:Uncharacterized protein n=1 Tax=Steinernema hermaphroditum TaxID=289476 RepID=A0AA39ISY9_9BILA|nr:hypothetical protein QR680_010828 [Steinernema hermaphroditum]